MEDQHEEDTQNLQRVRPSAAQQAEEFAANYQAASEKAEATKALIEAHDRNMFHLMITNWRGVFDAEDQALSFSADNLNMALGFDRIRVGLNRAYEEAVSNDKARLGNSKALH